jgi:hypothetical protein
MFEIPGPVSEAVRNLSGMKWPEKGPQPEFPIGPLGEPVAQPMSLDVRHRRAIGCGDGIPSLKPRTSR